MAEKSEEFNLPNSIIMRILKDAIPEGVNVSKEARAAFSRAASVFILYLTTSANNFSVKAKRKMLIADDVLLAVKDLELENMSDTLIEALKTFRVEKSRRGQASIADTEQKNGDLSYEDVESSYENIEDPSTENLSTDLSSDPLDDEQD